MDKTREKSAKTVTETRCDARRKTSKMKNKLYENFEKAEETRRASHRHTEEILDEEKEKVAEVRRIDSKNMAGNMADMEEKSSEVRQVTCHRMADIEEEAA